MLRDEPTVEMMDGFDPAELENNQPGPDQESTATSDKPAKKDEDPLIVELRRQNKALVREQRRMLETFARPAPAAAPAKAKDEDEDEDIQLSVDLTEAITANDPKALKKAMKEMGLLTQKDVEKMLAAQQRSASEGMSLAQQYPDLTNSKSEFFQLTNQVLQELKAENPGVAEMTLIRLAAKQADAELGSKSGRRAPVRREDDDDRDDDDNDEEEQDRIRRVGRQANGQRRRVEDRGTGGKPELTASQKRIVDNFRAAGSNITYESYAKRANAGVQMSNRGRR